MLRDIFTFLIILVAASCDSKLRVSKFDDTNSPWNFPVVPAKLPSDDELQRLMYNNSNGKLIPRHLWMAFKEVPEEKDMKDYLIRMFKRNTEKNWILHLEDNKGKLDFMRKYFNGKLLLYDLHLSPSILTATYSGTSLLWAYEVIHPQVGNSAADIWRYGVLWLLGGLYMDDDSYFEAPFDEVIHSFHYNSPAMISIRQLIGATDTLLIASEKNAYHDDCFLPHFHLSARSMHHRFNRSVGHLFGGRTLVSWGIFASPRHPIILRTMKNIVELIKYEYFRKSVVNLYKFDVRWKICMCTTGPPVLTASAREILLELGEKNVNYKLFKRDFQEYGGVFKMPDYNDKGVHYMHTMQKYNIPLLGEYAELGNDELEDRIISADGKVIISFGSQISNRRLH